MTLVLFPCEIYHREFDSKLMIAHELAEKYKVQSLIGYDKYFNELIPLLSSSVLMDKSCSSIIYKARILSLKQRGGTVLISDEEGFNNLTESNHFRFDIRLDKQLPVQLIYACWERLIMSFKSSHFVN